MTPFLERLRRSDGARAFVEHVHELAGPSLGQGTNLDRADPPADRAGPGPRAQLEREGYTAIARIAPAPDTGALRRAILALVDAGLPAVTALLLLETWSLAQRTQDRVSAMMHRPYVLLEDGWAWSISPGGAGWPPHRGGGDTLCDRSAPELLTVWIALGDVAADQACMHVVPLEDDPNYPLALHCVDVPAGAARALPIDDGTALVWNANILHWGGPSDARAKHPRVSCSFSLGRADRVPVGMRVLDVGRLDVERRVDVFADQIVMYGAEQPDIAPDVLTWARGRAQLRSLCASGGETPDAPHFREP